MTKTTGGPRKLDPESLVASALWIADEEGLEALTIRRLAQHHQVTPMALYRHFKDKDQLLDAMAARLLADVRIPEAADDAPWDHKIHDLFRAILDAIRPHPGVAALTFRRFLTAEPGLALSEQALGYLIEGGLSKDLAAQFGVQAVCALVNLVAIEPGMDDQHLEPEAKEDELRAKRSRLASLNPRRYPHVVASADALTCVFDRDDYFDKGLEFIVAGLRGVATGQPPHPRV